MSHRLLVVEDEASIRGPLVDVLKVKGYNVAAAERGDDALTMALQGGYDLILLDLMLPGLSGFDVLKALRGKAVNTPVIVLTARGQEMDRVLGFELGVDDYVTKPFSLLELLGRINAVLRRSNQAPSVAAEVRVGEGTFDMKAMTAGRDGEAVALPARAFRILSVLMEHAGQVVTRDALMDAVWGADEAVNERTLNNLMVKLRQIVEPEPSTPRWIVSVHGVGYRLEKS